MTRTRSPTSSTSGSSEEIIRTATPSAASWASSRCTSALVPMSMPRVGSSTISSVGLAAQPLGQHHLLLVAAGQPGHRVGEPAVLQVEPVGPVGRERPLGRRPDQAALAQPAERGERHVLLHRHLHDQALLAPVLGDEADARGHGRGRRRPAQLAGRGSAPGRRRSGRCRTPPGPPRCGPDPTSPASATISPARTVERDVGEHPFPGQPLDPEHLAGRGGSLAARSVHRPADHRADQVIGRQPGQLAGQHVPAVAHHGHPLADLEDLLQPVRDEQHRRARPRAACAPPRTAGPPRPRTARRSARP